MPGDGSLFAPVAVAGSAGASVAMSDILAQLSPRFPAPILFCQHMSSSYSGKLPEVLRQRTNLRVAWAQHGDSPRPGSVYLCPPGHSMEVRDDGRLAVQPASLRDTLKCADRLLSSIAARYQQRAVAVLLSGAGRDGSDGAHDVHEHRGTVLAQSESSCLIPAMPRAASATGCVDIVLPPHQIAPALLNIVRDGHAIGAVKGHAAHSGIGLTRVLQYTLERILTDAIDAVGADFGNLQLVNRRTHTLGIAVQRGFGIDFLDHFRSVGLRDGSACGRAFRHRATTLIANIADDEGFATHRDIARSAGFRAVQSTPLITRSGRLLGMLSVHFRTPRSAAPRQMRYVETRAFHGANTVERLSAFS